MTATTHVLAGRGRRLVATAIDALLVPLLTVFLVMVTDVVEDVEDYQTRAWILHVFLLAVLSYLLLNGYLLATRAQTKPPRNEAAVPIAKPAIESQETGSDALNARWMSSAEAPEEASTIE